MKLLCVILKLWTHDIIHLSKPIEWTSPRVNSKVKYGLWVIITMCQWRSLIVTGAQPWWEVDDGEIVHLWVQGHVGNLYLPLNFAAYPKLL